MFTADARDQTDLQVLTAQVVDIVQDTMQPEQVSLWILDLNPGRQPESRSKKDLQNVV
ncbi:MAG: hypothetical protein JSV61_04885 [Anaerolineales bacterium]|nr:MAG: hypothetical protein JSV61_04885 [Anaerolineales bacterium]HSF79757.1 hypothetical protein [Anaerolineales bacterium]